MKQITTYVGIDAHKKDLFLTMLVGTEAPPVSWTSPNEPKAVKRLVRKLERDAPGAVRVFYEAGPCGYALQRQVTTARVSCEVVAPVTSSPTETSGIPSRPRTSKRWPAGTPGGPHRSIPPEWRWSPMP